MVLVRETTIERIIQLLIDSECVDRKERDEILDDLKEAKGGYGPHGPRTT